MAKGLAVAIQAEQVPVPVPELGDGEKKLVRAFMRMKAASEQRDSDRRNILHRTLSTDGILKSISDAFYGSKRKCAKFHVYTSSHLRAFTDDFNVTKMIGRTQFGELYRGTIRIGSEFQNVVVKIWTKESDVLDNLRVPYLFVDEEVRFLKDETIASHPNLVNVIGKCCEENVKGVVYDLDPLDSLHNMTMKDDFSWIQRVDVALKIAHLLEFLHKQEKPYTVLNLHPLHIMLDHMFNPILIDFGLLSGGIIGPVSFIKSFVWPSIGYTYTDPDYVSGCPARPSCDVYAYGGFLIGLIAKREEEDLSSWAEEEYKTKRSLVHRSLELEKGYCASDGDLLSDLCMRCVKWRGGERPTMGEVKLFEAIASC